MEKNTQTVSPDRNDTGLLQRITGIFIFFIISICPLKFGSVINNTGTGIYPLSIHEWAFSIWPPVLTCLFSSIALLLSLMSNKLSIVMILKNTMVLILPFFLLFCTTFIGIINSSERDYTIIFIWHMLSAVNFLFAVVIFVQNHPKSRNIFLTAVCLGTFLSILSGIYQIHIGFEETRDIAIQLAESDGRILHPDMISRLNQNRAYAAFTYPNSYAAHLILTMPLLIAFIWKRSKSIHPAFISRITFSGTFFILSIYCLMSTGSRGAITAITVSIIFILAIEIKQLKTSLNLDKKIIFSGSLFLSILSIILLIIVFKQRDLLSVSARMDYYSAAVKLFLEHPVAGIGLGEFFPNYLRIKPPSAEETRLVHNMVLHFLSQCGLFGGVAALIFLLHPLIIWRSYKKQQLKCIVPEYYFALLTGYTAWLCHSLSDFNIQITGTLLIAVILPPLVMAGHNDLKNEIHSGKSISICFYALAIIGFSSIIRISGEKAYQRLYNKQSKPVTANSLTNEVKAASIKMPYSPYPWDILGKKALSQSQLELAIIAFEEAKKRTPHRASYYAYTAHCLLLKGNIPEALKNIDSALQWYPHKPEYQRLKKKIVKKSP